MSPASPGWAMSNGVAPMWDVSRVQHKVLAGCPGRLTSVGCPRITPFYWRLRGQELRWHEASLSRGSEKLGLTLTDRTVSFFQMFATPQNVAAGLREAGYATDPVLVQIIWLATKNQNPILVVDCPPTGEN